MGFVFDDKAAAAYTGWLDNPRNRLTAHLQSRMMVDLLEACPGQRLLGIGCGTGTSLVPFVEKGLLVSGIEPSAAMRVLARKRLGHRVDLQAGFAEDLPYDDNTFDYACMVTSLEFVDDPVLALEEAFRVTKDRVFIGVLNRWAIKGIQRRITGIFSHSIYNQASFYSVWELKKQIHQILGPVPVYWRTVNLFPSGWRRLSGRLERTGLIQKSPFGAFVGMVVVLAPRYRTTPLSVTCKQRPAGLMAG